MLGIQAEEEAALAYLMIHDEDSSKTYDDERLVKAMIKLRDAEMIDAESDMSLEIACVKKVLPAGIAHYESVLIARRHFVSLSETADELMDVSYVDEKRRRKDNDSPFLATHDDRIEDYRELGSAGLLVIHWADCVPWTIAMTEKGMSYVRGDFVEGGTVVNNVTTNVNPIISVSGGNNSATSSANATATNEVTLDSVIDAIHRCDLPEDIKDQAEASIDELNRASRERDNPGFFAALEKLASIAKETGVLGSMVLPLLEKLIGRLLVGA